MRLLQDIRRAANSLALHRLRTLLSTLGILFGVAAVVAMLSIGEGAKWETLQQIEQLGMNSIIIRQNVISNDERMQIKNKKSLGLTLEDVEQIKKNVPNVISIAPIKIIKAGVPSKLKNSAPEIIAANGDYGKIKSLKLNEGRFICDVDQSEHKLVCILGFEVAKALGQTGHVGENLRIEKTLYQIVGIIKPSQVKESKNVFLASNNVNQAIFIPLGSENELRSNLHPENDYLSEIILQIKPQQDLTKTAQLIEKILKRSHAGYLDYQIVIPKELLNQAHQTQKTFNLVLGSIAAISLLVGGIGIMNMMLANVTERIREIGIRRALGARKKDILIQFLTETLLLTLFGAVLGIISGIAFSMLISHLAGWKTIVTIWSVSLSLGMATIVGFFSGFYPSYQAANLNPIAALRQE